MAVLTVPAGWRKRSMAVTGPLADAAGRATGRALSVSHLVPGLAGAAGFSLALGELAGHVFGHGLTPWVSLAVGSLFALALDRQLP